MEKVTYGLKVTRTFSFNHESMVLLGRPLPVGSMKVLGKVTTASDFFGVIWP